MAISADILLARCRSWTPVPLPLNSTAAREKDGLNVSRGIACLPQVLQIVGETLDGLGAIL